MNSDTEQWSDAAVAPESMAPSEPDTPLARARKAVAGATIEVDFAARALNDARVDEATAMGHYDQDGGNAARERLRDARDDRERAERRHAARLAELDAATAAAAAEQLAADEAELHEGVAFLASFDKRVWPELQALVELDRRAFDIVERIKKHERENGLRHARATKLADELGGKLKRPVYIEATPPEHRWVMALARIAIAIDRNQGGRRHFSNGWVEAQWPPDTSGSRLATYNAAEDIVRALERGQSQ